MSTTTTGEVWAEAVLRSGTERVPKHACEELATHQRKCTDLMADAKFAPDYKAQQASQMDDEMDTRLIVLESEDVAAALREVDREAGEIKAEIKGTLYTADPARQTKDLERTIAISNDLAVAQSTTDYAALADLFDEVLVSDQPDRIRRVGQVIRDRLFTMATGTTDEPLRASAREVMVAFDAWAVANPSRAQRLRAMKEKREQTELDVRQRYRTLRELARFRS